MSLSRIVSNSAGLALALAAFFPATAAPPPPPSPAFLEAIRHSCGTEKAPTLESVPVTVTPVDEKTLIAPGAADAKLRWRWGLRITSRDPRLSSIAGLEFDDRYGLVAVTSGGNWLTFDLQGATLAGLKSVGIAPVRHALGRPEAIAAVYKAMLVSFPEQHAVGLLGFSDCGTAAATEPWLSIAGEPQVRAVAVAAATRVALMGQESGGPVRDALLLPYERQTVALDHSDLSPLAGYHLQAASNPSRIVPWLFLVWRRDGAAETIIQENYVEAWGDVWTNEKRRPVELARLRRPIRAIASFYDRSSGQSWLIMAEDGGEPGSVVLYAFTRAST